MGTNNYIVILDWMVSELGLRGNELLVYALIFGFSQDGESEFTGSIQYICDRTGVTRNTTKNILKQLVADELLIKRDIKHQGVKYCTYRANLDRAIFDQVGQFPYGGGAKIDIEGRAKIAPNNKDIDNKDNIKQEKEKTTTKVVSKKFDVMRYMTERNVPESVATDFIALRKVKRAPLTETALKGIEREAAKARISLGTAIEVCCANGWQGFRAEWYNRDKGKVPEIYVDMNADYGDYEREQQRRAEWYKNNK